jgi:hypothetical protein
MGEGGIGGGQYMNSKGSQVADVGTAAMLAAPLMNSSVAVAGCADVQRKCRRQASTAAGSVSDCHACAIRVSKQMHEELMPS